jgi:hypothetical protein
MSSFLQKATPFFEHIVLGLAFAAIGYSFFWTFNTSFVGILGMVAVCFGGLKLLVGIIIYGGWLAAVIFRPDYLKKKEQQELEETVRKKAEEANMSFLKKYWGMVPELSVLLVGFLTIIITRGT